MAIVQEWTRIQPYGEASYTWWINGIYKIVSYSKGEYFAFYITDHYKNWGDYVSKPPHSGTFGDCWSSFESAKAACVEHAKWYVAAPKTVKRAAELKAQFIADAEAYAQKSGVK